MLAPPSFRIFDVGPQQRGSGDELSPTSGDTPRGGRLIFIEWDAPGVQKTPCKSVDVGLTGWTLWGNLDPRPVTPEGVGGCFLLLCCCCCCLRCCWCCCFLYCHRHFHHYCDVSSWLLAVVRVLVCLLIGAMPKKGRLVDGLMGWFAGWLVSVVW